MFHEPSLKNTNVKTVQKVKIILRNLVERYLKICNIVAQKGSTVSNNGSVKTNLDYINKGKHHFLLKLDDTQIGST